MAAVCCGTIGPKDAQAPSEEDVKATNGPPMALQGKVAERWFDGASASDSFPGKTGGSPKAAAWTSYAFCSTVRPASSSSLARVSAGSDASSCSADGLGGRAAGLVASKSSICTSRSVRVPSSAPGFT